MKLLSAEAIDLEVQELSIKNGWIEFGRDGDVDEASEVDKVNPFQPID